MTNEQEKKLDEVHTAIVGNKLMRHKGIIERLEELEHYKHKSQLKQVAQSGLFSIGGVSIIEIIKHLISK